jgi:hypothetical protein
LLLVQHPAIGLTCADGNGRNPLMLTAWGDRKDRLISNILTRRRMPISIAESQ